MDNPDSYKKTSNLRDDDQRELLDEFAPTFNWRVDGKDSVMDIGCAGKDDNYFVGNPNCPYVVLGGNVTCDIILPKLPPTFSRLIGVDVNDNMVDYATKNYTIPKVSFRKLDIGSDISEFMRENEPFDHIISFFCLHLVPDQKLAMQNIFKLLGINGDCFLHVIADFTATNIFKKMYTKWSEYMVDIDNFVSPYYHRINPAGMLKNHLKNAGFKECNVIERSKTIAYHDVQTFTDAYKPVLPFFSRIPLERQSEFLDEYVKLSMEVKADPEVNVKKFKASQNVNIFVTYKELIAYARK